MTFLKLIIWDCDGTLTTVKSAWQWVHEELGTWETGGQQHLQDFLQGIIDYEEFALRDVTEWKDLLEEELISILNRIPYRKHASEVLDYCYKLGIDQILISSGLSQLTDIIARQFPVFSKVIANQIEIERDRLNGKVNIQVPWGGKGKIAKDVCNEFGITPQEVIAIGDSSSDIEIFQFVKYSISINAPEEVSKITTWSVKELGEIPGIIKIIENKH